MRVSDPGNGVASGSGRAGLGVGLKVLVGTRVAFRFWSVPGLELAQGSGAVGLALGRLWDQSFQGSHGRPPQTPAHWGGHLRLLLLGLDVLGLGLRRHNLI